MKSRKTKPISTKERNRRLLQGENNTLYCAGDGSTFRMTKKAKNAYQIH